MDTLLDALQEGRLFELPENDKTHALQFLAHVIEAFPETPAGTDVVGLVLKREEAANTGLGKGWACPHARVPYEEDLMCVIGWSPSGINYGAPDGQPVSIIVMHVVPDNQRSHYLREISILAKALSLYKDVEKIHQAKNLDDVRLYLLEMIETTKMAAGPDARAKMISLQTKAAAPAFPLPELNNLLVEPITIIAGPGLKPIILSQNPALTDQLESWPDLVEKLETEGVYQNGGWRIMRRSATAYQRGRVVYDCLAIKIIAGSSIK
ncbi:MAG: PTS sugar transporter subunit IIA [Candidatus Aminicenantes bacterium]|jgi:Phosphotransferase system mannitol/fructose-specific IIA domain (Ntr-type)|nr:PTS sugar transporter subunit IIA [Candidatus Aminicenantes bacterium]